MATVAAFLVPLALLHATYGRLLPAPDYLDIVGTDAINDVIRAYNNHYKSIPPPVLADVKNVTVKTGTPGVDTYTYNVSASEGKILSKGIKMGTRLADVSLEVRNDVHTVLHNLTVAFPITFRDLKLQFDRIHVEYTEDVKPTKAPPRASLRSAPAPSGPPKGEPSGAVKVLIGKNKFAIQAQIAHFYDTNNTLTVCVATVTKAEPEQFEVKNITISGMQDPWLQEHLDLLANEFKIGIWDGRLIRFHQSAYIATATRRRIQEFHATIVTPKEDPLLNTEHCYRDQKLIFPTNGV